VLTSTIANRRSFLLGATAKGDLEKLREVYKKRQPVDFLAEITGQVTSDKSFSSFQVFSQHNIPINLAIV
jgi:hypothetical protein